MRRGWRREANRRKKLCELRVDDNCVWQPAQSERSSFGNWKTKNEIRSMICGTRGSNFNHHSKVMKHPCILNCWERVVESLAKYNFLIYWMEKSQCMLRRLHERTLELSGEFHSQSNTRRDIRSWRLLGSLQSLPSEKMYWGATNLT